MKLAPVPDTAEVGGLAVGGGAGVVHDQLAAVGGGAGMVNGQLAAVVAVSCKPLVSAVVVSDLHRWQWGLSRWSLPLLHPLVVVAAVVVSSVLRSSSFVPFSASVSSPLPFVDVWPMSVVQNG